MSWLLSIWFVTKIFLGAFIFAVCYALSLQFIEDKFGIPFVFGMMGSFLIFLFILFIYLVHSFPLR